MMFAATIIVPVLRQNDVWLEQCVRSALSQSVPCEVIVVTASKTPAGNLTILQSLAREGERLRLLPEETPGFASAFNTGIRAATTDRVGFLLSDDWLDPHAVEHCLRFDTDIVSTWMTIHAEAGSELPPIRRQSNMAIFDGKATLEEKASYISHFFLFNRDMVLRVGGVDETVGNTGPDDYDLIWTLLEQGCSVAIAEAFLYHMRDHPGERLTLKSRESQIENLKRILRKHGVVGEERERLIEAHGSWYGRQVHAVKLEKDALRAKV